VGTEPDLAPRLSLPNQGIEIPLPDGSEVIVGREDPYSGIFPDVDLSPYGADEAGVSRRHFRIRRQGDQFTIEDLNSTNMTFLNRQQLTPGTPVPLSDGDEIRAGRLKLTFQVSP
jgi:pSer/pThr/pTyr-binding forkhead associated (FHA) protein